MQRLPQVGRDPYELVRLTPGVFGLGARSGTGDSVRLPNQAGPGGSNNSVFQTENQVPISANGQRVEANNYQTRRRHRHEPGLGRRRGGHAQPGIGQGDPRLSSSYSAESGGTPARRIQVVSQNGTNDFHGSAVFKRNTPGLNAYQKWGGPHGEAPQRVNQPAQPDGRELRRADFPRTSCSSSSRSRTSAGAAEPQHRVGRDARAGRRDQGAAPGQPGRAVPELPRHDPAARGERARNARPRLADGRAGSADRPIRWAADWTAYPTCSAPSSKGSTTRTARQFNTRVDYSVTQMTSSRSACTSCRWTPRSNDRAVWANTARPMGDFTSERRNMAGTLLWTRTLSPTMINEARFNVTRWYLDEIASNPDTPWGLPRL